MHIHGHQFQVLKIGFSKLDPNSKLAVASSGDFCCNSNDSTCDRVTWCDPTWLGGRVPGLIDTGAPYKDTIAIPVGGYAVVRIFTDNPGLFMVIY